MRGTHLDGSLLAPGPGQAMDQALAVGVSHSCGLGRREPEAAERALWRVAELAEETPA